tara:strand:+ start:5250 stop:5630 length:381 start_codon:yes stop_codon:yes gene_type:complete
MTYECNSFFYKYIEDNKDKSLKYGVWDCFIFVKGIHKTSIGDEFKGNYKYKKEYFERLKEIGFTTIKSYCDEKLITIENKQLQRTDIVIYKDALGLCDGINSIFLNKKGYTFVKTNLVDKGYRCHK